MNDETKAPLPPFVRYERTVVETRDIAEVTEENIGRIAALVKAQVETTPGVGRGGGE